ncbi:hypothetical protein Ga0100231_009455 [Opitutaceae bacterium TAV4]|nr:hypothetical protein Ga0100231_009455 [Opitutaceae bacterium TAV4]RRJ98603.1 hypothetical protein Ga0100230_009555 [Opitutaceae bacterium TAV3]
MHLHSQRLFYAVLVPLAVLLIVAALAYRPLVNREATLDQQLAELQATLIRTGHGADPAGLERQAGELARETTQLRAIATQSHSLDRAPLVVTYGDQPFQLIEFEQQRAAATAAATAAADKAGVKLAASAFDVLSDTVPTPTATATAAATPPPPADPRRRWAQLALARLVANHAIAARVATYEALPVPAVREMRLNPGSPILAVEVLFSARVTGKSDRVQAFLEQLALGSPSPDGKPTVADDHLLIEHLVLRKEGTAATDDSSATVVVAALLSATASSP